MTFRGLTWDHPRGRLALETAAATVAPGLLSWRIQPLEGFESAPIGELAAAYDLVVLDHPHLGDALAADCLVPLDDVFTPAQLERWRTASVGSSFASYEFDGRVWALPLDAATQVTARNPTLVPESPATWHDALALSREGRVATSLAGPHAFLSLCSIAVSLGDDPGRGDGGLFDAALGAQALDILIELSAHAPAGTGLLNPIGLLDRMRDEGDIGCIPLVYGYVTYSSPSVVFSDAPAGPAGIGSTIGGTGIALTRRSPISEPLVDHLAWLLDDQTQRTFIPAHAGQPSARSAWTDDAVNAGSRDFYRGTLATMERAWMRPRRAGYIPFQSHASAVVREAAAGERSVPSALRAMEEAFAALPSPPHRFGALT
ncbi:extracellular solute-binding protein [Microbacterium sp. UBA3394]|uniref:extracellular solute-binding protein n=1 Tax=Microbacterium sp. UBA3394 TaxID=1946945 RepID=UPI00257F623E|nr:extracellular solute-binding protein [Microbacterium sp. UBA3394]|tara:strand:- start:7416 stop:8534 length:1119 start_codon:yes stop_codon:yes gene_type:complete